MECDTKPSVFLMTIKGEAADEDKEGLHTGGPVGPVLRYEQAKNTQETAFELERRPQIKICGSMSAAGRGHAVSEINARSASACGLSGILGSELHRKPVGKRGNKASGAGICRWSQHLPPRQTRGVPLSWLEHLKLRVSSFHLFDSQLLLNCVKRKPEATHCSKSEEVVLYRIQLQRWPWCSRTDNS